MEKDIRFTEKKVDADWKEQAQKDQGPPAPESSKPAETSKPFLNFISSLGFQAMMQLGEIPNPETQQSELNLDAAREILDLLVALKEKSDHNRSREEDHFFSSVLPELQLKFAEKA